MRKSTLWLMFVAGFVVFGTSWGHAPGMIEGAALALYAHVRLTDLEVRP